MWWLVVLIVPLVLFISVVWPGLIGAPWVPTQMKVVRQMLTMAKVGPGDVLYDLGCGDGRLVIAAARDYGARAVGVEIEPLRYLWCQMRITTLGLRDRVRVVFGNFFLHDLSEADVVTCYLLEDTNNKLEKKLVQELRPSARVVSNTYVFHKLHLVRHDSQANLYLYRLER
jgi:predicted RNA methylase